MVSLELLKVSHALTCHLHNLSTHLSHMKRLHVSRSLHRYIFISRDFHCSSNLSAIAHPLTAHGPPPKAPAPAPEFACAEGRKQADLIQHGREAQAQPTRPVSALKKRFWEDVNIKKTQGRKCILFHCQLVYPRSVGQCA